MEQQANYIEFLFHEELVRINFDEEKQLSPTTTVLEWLRSLDDYKAVKEACAEGDCGACTIVLVELQNGKLKYRSLTSCILFLPYLNGKQLITLEHLSPRVARLASLHPVQKAVANHQASQCGYCTPGIVMSLFSFYKNKESEDDIATSLSGNLCRCTGYESIRKAAIEVSHLPDMEDDFDRREDDIVQRLKEMNDAKIPFSVKSYYQAQELQDALVYKNDHPDSVLIGGASDIALLKTKKHQEIPFLLDLSQIGEMRQIAKNEDYWEIGASARIEDIRKELSNQWPDFAAILNVFASKQIRNVATLGGNIGSASPIGDLLPLLISHQAEIVIQSKDDTRTEQLQDFILAYKKTSLMPNEIITKVLIPIDKQWFYWSEKVSKRKQLDISTLSVAFSVRLTKNNKISSIVLAYGGMAAMPVRAHQAEEYLLGKKSNRENFNQAAELIKKEFEPLSDARASKEGRSLLASNLLIKFYYEIDKKYSITSPS